MALGLCGLMSLDSDSAVTALLQRYSRFGIELGLSRIQSLLQALGSPHQQVPIIHVAGTNGKGSVCAYLSSVLTTAGFRVGRYTSPHLVQWTERICLNEQPVSASVLLAALQDVEAAIDPTEDCPTQFEVLTAAAWLIFAQAQVEIAVVEVGLGGRLDATNVCDRPLVSVITSISRDHWQRLGDSLSAIAAEKAGILKAGCPAVIGPLPPEAESVVQAQLEALGCPTQWPSPAQWHQPPSPHETAWAISQDLYFPLPLGGEIQLTNAAVAIAVLRQLQTQGWAISAAQIAKGMAQTRWPGRLQWAQWQGSPLLLDGAHNAAAAQALRHYVDQILSSPQFSSEAEPPAPKATVTWIIGMLATKDHTAILQALLRPRDQLLLVPVPGHDSANPTDLIPLAHRLCPALGRCWARPDWTAGLEAATPSQGLNILCGSLYLVGAFWQQTTALEAVDALEALG